MGHAASICLNDLQDTQISIQIVSIYMAKVWDKSFLRVYDFLHMIKLDQVRIL